MINLCSEHNLLGPQRVGRMASPDGRDRTRPQITATHFHVVTEDKGVVRLPAGDAQLLVRARKGRDYAN